MGLGAILPNSGPLADGFAAAALAAEAAGVDSVWVSDHLLLIDRAVTDYPFSADGHPTWSPDTDWYEALTCCSYLAAITSRVRIGTATLILPQRNVLQLAKETATIDRLSDGRLQLGVGVGWSAAEMAALGYDYGSRGIRFEEMVTVLRDCWGGQSAAFDGAALQVEEGLRFNPRPDQPDGPPVLIGGMSAVAIRRAATIGDGWLAIAFTDDWDARVLGAGLHRFSALSTAAQHRLPRRALLKLHCRDGNFDRMDGCLERAYELGFDEVMVDVPWGLGPAAATDMLMRLRAVGASL
jgi:probable F420-dependent oxidoreductase